jgi:hypothetical protein
MARAMYALLTPTPFWIPGVPEPWAIYYPMPIAIVDNAGAPVLDAEGQPTFNVPPTIDRATQATINSPFSRECNYWLLYLNIQHAVYNLFDDNIDNAFKVANTPALVGWNPTMEIRNVFDQITNTYGRPTPTAILQNDTLFRSVYSPHDAPEVLFRRIKDCQEVQILGEDPYTAQQLLNNAVRLLLQCGLYSRDIEDWDRKTASNKIWTNVKTFVQECYTRRLNTTNITAGLPGYVQNAFAALGKISNKDDDNEQMVIYTKSTHSNHNG